MEFWNFSIDEFAFHDIPDSIAYILDTTGQPSLSYIGFSQGTAQAFASLAVHPKLNDQVNVFIALAPAMSPAGLSNGIVDALVKASPQVLFLLFGRRSILSSATMWQSLLYPPLFTRVIDMGLSFLFNWKTANMSTSQKLAAYPHLYSFTSTKSVVHWFQIIRTKSFQMYDDDVQPPMLLSSSSKYTKVAKYPTRNIKTPVVLVYGGSDSLVDIKVMLRELPSQTVANEIPHYEHLDFLWARDVDSLVFPHVFDALESFTGAEHTKEEYERYRSARHSSLSASTYFRRHTQRNSDPALDSDVSTAVAWSVADDGLADAAVEHLNDVGSPDETGTGSEVASLHAFPSMTRHQAHGSHYPGPKSSSSPAQPRSIRPNNGSEAELGYLSPLSPQNVRFQEGQARQAAGGVDGPMEEERDKDHYLTAVRRTPKRRGTGGSQMSVDSMKRGRGISLGAGACHPMNDRENDVVANSGADAGKAVGGVTTSGADFPIDEGKLP